jgi:hypothetical protein
MKAACFVIITDRNRWHVARVAGPDVEIRPVAVNTGDDQGQPVQLAVDELKSLGYRSQGICLALGSEMVLADQIDCNNIPRKDRSAAMVFRLEEQLPLAAEQFTANFLPPAGGRSLGLAVQTADVQAIVDQLTEAGVETASICPAAMLAMWQCVRGSDKSSDYVILADEYRAEIFRTAGHRQPITWSTSKPGPEQLLGCLHADMLAFSLVNSCPTVRLFGTLPADAAAALNGDEGLDIIQSDQTPPLVATVLAAGALLSGRSAGWVDLRCGDLAPPNQWEKLAGLTNLAALLLVTVMALTAAMFHWRGSQYESLALASQRQQRDQYARLYPGRRGPLSVISALRSELKRLSGISGAGDKIPLQVNALNALRSIIASLPPAIRLRIIDIRITPNSVFIEGQVRDHTGAELICQSIRRAGFDMDPPRTEHLSRGGVSFTLTGKPRASDPQIAATNGGRP